MSQLQFRYNSSALDAVKKIAFEETVNAFELDIVPEAKQNSPVTPEGLAKNIEKHRTRPGGTGTNRRSIDAEVVISPQGPKATLFTSSGYGGYLEVGTSKMRAQPYLYPAFTKFIGKLKERIQQRVGKAR